ncbi:MAG: branched-chain amino acid ABC transporter permease [Candidatus Fimivivens sp.]
MKKIKVMNKTAQNNFLNYVFVTVAFIILQMLMSGGQLSSSLKGQLVPICAYIVMAISLNLTVGILGELSLGHAGFMGVGAFTGVIVTMSLKNVIVFSPLRLVIAMLAGGIIAGLTSLLVGVPVLRLRGDYLAIVTLAFGEIVKNIVNCLYVGVDQNGVHFSMTDSASLGLVDGGIVIVNGPMGAVGVTKLSTFAMGYALVIVTLIVVQNLINSRTGRAIMALRDNRIAAESLGINITKYKLLAFSSSAVLAGMAGVLFAMNYSTVVAKKFDFNTSILVLVFVVLGGMGNIRGSIIAAAVLTVMPELLRGFSDYRMLVYAVVLVVAMLLTHGEKGRRLFEYLKEKATTKKSVRKEGAQND